MCAITFDGNIFSEAKGITDASPTSENTITIKILSKCSDFAAEKPLLQKVLEKHGQMVHWLPKYHAPCNASEYFWGNGKKRFGQNCDTQ